jgi:mono/diheme cytochrome c family protein
VKSLALRALGAAAALILGGCATNVPPVTPQMAAAVGQSSTVLEHGRQLYAGPCTACHSPESIGKYSAGQWREIMADMGERAKLSPADREAVLAYVLAVRAAPPPQG